MMSKEETEEDPNPEKIAKEFQSQLRKFFRRIDPWDYSRWASVQLAKSLDDPDLIGRYPPHVLIQSIEANLAYHQPTYDQVQVDKNTLVRAVNLYHQYTGRIESARLKGGLEVEEFLEGMAQEQFPVQERHGSEDIGRSVLLYKKQTQLSRSADQFRHKYGLTVDQWFLVLFIVFSQVNRRMDDRLPPTFLRNHIIDFPMEIIQEKEAEGFLATASRTPTFFKETFFERRSEKVSPSLYSQIRLSFLDYPIIDFGSDRYLVPNADFLLRHSWSGLHCMLSQFPEFPREIAKTFEKYVGSVLDLLPKISKIWNPKEVEKITEGKAADFVLEFEDFILLVECKIADYSANLRTRNAISNSNIVGKIAKAFHQIGETVESFKNQGLIRDRKCIGIVATLGDLYHPNSEWFRQIVLERYNNGDVDQIVSATPIQVMPVRVLEEFIAASIHLGKTPRTLFEDKEAVPYGVGGDWSTFFRHYLSLPMGTVLQHMTIPMKAAEEFFTEVQELMSTSGHSRPKP